MNAPDLVIQEKKIKIGLLEAVPFLYKDMTGNITGIEYDILQTFIKQHNLKTEITFISQEERTKSYNEYVQDVADGKFDILLGNVTQTHERSKIITYSHPLYFDILSIFYEPSGTNQAISNNYYYKMVLIVLQFIALILVLGFFLAFIHYYSSNFKTTFLASLWRVYAALLGEPGLGVHPTKFNENVNRGSLINLTFRALLILLSALFGIYLGAIITSERLGSILTNAPFSHLKDLNNKSVLVFKGSSDAATLKALESTYNIKIVEFDHGSYNGKDLSKYFEKNKHKLNLDGMIMASESFRYEDKGEKYKRGTLLFPKSITGAVFNNRNKPLIKKFNQTLHTLRESSSLIKLCKKYFKDVKDVCIQ